MADCNAGAGGAGLMLSQILEETVFSRSFVTRCEVF